MIKLSDGFLFLKILFSKIQLKFLTSKPTLFFGSYFLSKTACGFYLFFPVKKFSYGASFSRISSVDFNYSGINVDKYLIFWKNIFWTKVLSITGQWVSFLHHHDWALQFSAFPHMFLKTNWPWDNTADCDFDKIICRPIFLWL